MRMEITYASPSSGDISGDLTSGSMPTTGRPVKVIALQHPTASTSSSPPVFHLVSRWRSKLKRMTSTEWIELFLPCYRWLRFYKWRDYFQLDLMAGITVGVMLVPQ
ncbi:hypothetical protein U1Q18_026110, partial [Sarracenia purpurea var. burkii]